MQSFLTSKEKLKDDDNGDDGNNDTSTWRVRGIAWGGGSGVGVAKIQLTTDDSGEWSEVPLRDWQVGPSSSSSGREWSWIVFDTVVKSRSGRFTCRMVDKQDVMQPQGLWYPRGISATRGMHCKI